jgi:predicted RNase H-like nuclease (RuvC/YqgF family)
MNTLVKRYNILPTSTKEATPSPQPEVFRKQTEPIPTSKELKLLQEKYEIMKEENQSLKMTVKRQRSELEAKEGEASAIRG